MARDFATEEVLGRASSVSAPALQGAFDAVRYELEVFEALYTMFRNLRPDLKAALTHWVVDGKEPSCETLQSFEEKGWVEGNPSKPIEQVAAFVDLERARYELPPEALTNEL